MARCAEGHENPDANRFCRECGSPLSAASPVDRSGPGPTLEAASWGLPQPPRPPQQHRTSNGLAVAALVLGIIGVLIGIIPILFFLAWLVGGVALIFGLVGRNKARQVGVGKGQATAGIVLGAIAIALGVVGIVIVNAVLNDTSDRIEELNRNLERDLGTLPRSPTTNFVPSTTVAPRALPEQVTLDEFNAIQNGMSYDDVVALIGGPGTVMSSSSSGSFSYESYTWDGTGELSSSALVQFQNGGVTSKSQFGLR